jgi:Holliday junction resolvase
MSKDGGFEREFRRSLGRMPGYSMRLYDNGGKPTDSTLLGDFVLFSDGGSYAFECKSTSGPSIRLRDPGEKGSGIHAEQLAELARFEKAGEGNTAYVALNYRRTGSLVLLRLEPILAFRKTKKSITEKEALDMGWAQKAHPDGGWRLKL